MCIEGLGLRWAMALPSWSTTRAGRLETPSQPARVIVIRPLLGDPALAGGTAIAFDRLRSTPAISKEGGAHMRGLGGANSIIYIVGAIVIIIVVLKVLGLY